MLFNNMLMSLQLDAANGDLSAMSYYFFLYLLDVNCAMRIFCKIPH